MQIVDNSVRDEWGISGWEYDQLAREGRREERRDLLRLMRVAILGPARQGEERNCDGHRWWQWALATALFPLLIILGRGYREGVKTYDAVEVSAIVDDVCSFYSEPRGPVAQVHLSTLRAWFDSM